MSQLVVIYRTTYLPTLVRPFMAVTEFGGSLGLFLGFSFMAVWDGMRGVYLSMLKLQNNPEVS